VRFSSLCGIWVVLAVLVAGGPALAQDISIDFGDGTSLATRSIQLLLLITVLSLVPGLAVMITCFPFIVTVLSILRQAIGLQQSPPNMLIVSLALFLTWFVMDPVLTQAWKQGIEPLTAGLIDVQPQAPTAIVDAPLSVLVPSFILSEIQRAFEIGFLIFLPFLVIDLVVAAVLMSMGMMMVPPAVVALPFKLAFFVVADGWTLISGALVRSYF
jgi:flagellar biosynthetic protein FliP